MVSVRRVPASDLETVRRLYNRFTAQDVAMQPFREHFEATPELFVGAYDEDEPVGICVGWTSQDAHAQLAGLGVYPSRRREGIGSRMVARFEANAASAGIERVSVASAGGYVDQFYAAQGYEATRVLVRVDPGDLPENYRSTFDVVEERVDEGTKKVYVDADEPDPAFLQAIREAFDDEEAIYIMRKSL